MRIAFLFFLLIICQMNAQEVLFEGHVYDTKTKEPIPFVNLSFLNTLKGTSTDEEGHFFIDVPKDYLDRQLHISSLGYNDSIILSKDLYESKRFEMVEESFELEEVVVTEKLNNSVFLNPINSYSITSGFASTSTPWVLALYFPNIGAQDKYVDVVTVFMQHTKDFDRPSASFRLRIYDVDPSSKKPKNDILRKSVLLESQKGKDYVTIDLAALKIKVPKDGIYIGLEWLFVPSNWYKNTYEHPITKKQVIEDRFAPTFGGVYSKNQNFKAVVYGMGQWNDFITKSKDRTQNFIPAISLKILRNK